MWIPPGRDFPPRERLAVNLDDFEAFDLLPLAPKKKDRRYQAFVNEHGEQCAELDALPARELRRRIREGIEQHIPTDEWERLRQVEEAEKESFENFLNSMDAA